MYTVEIYVSYKESILDPQGQAIKKAVHQMNYRSVESVRQGKYFEMTLDDSEENPVRVVEEISDKLLANVNTEQFVYTIWNVDARTGEAVLVANTKPAHTAASADAAAPAAPAADAAQA